MIATAPANVPTLSAPTDEPVAGNYFVAAYPPFSAWDSAQVPALHEALAKPALAEPIGLYVHLPFCQKKCDYCYYLSYIAQPAAVVDRYLDTVLREMELYVAQPGVKGRPVSFAYFGGGTPSTLSSAQVHRLGDGLRRALAWDSIEEVTFECAPRSVRREFLESLREMGVTRVSMGVQSFDNELLKLNGRVHLAEDVSRAYSLIREANFGCVNLDLMCGLMGETEEKWRESVRRVIELGPDSVTIYQTEIPHNTQLYRDLTAGALPAPPASWDIKRARLDEGFRELERAGYTVVSAYNAVKDPQRHRFLYQDYLWRGATCSGWAWRRSAILAAFMHRTKTPWSNTKPPWSGATCQSSARASSRITTSSCASSSSSSNLAKSPSRHSANGSAWTSRTNLPDRYARSLRKAGSHFPTKRCE